MTNGHVNECSHNFTIASMTKVYTIPNRKVQTVQSHVLSVFMCLQEAAICVSQFLAAQVKQKIVDVNKGNRAKRAGNASSPSPSVPLLNLLMEMGFNRRTVDAALKVFGNYYYYFTWFIILQNFLHLHLLYTYISAFQ